MKKGRLWATVGYPESLPIDWLERLSETGLQVAISPLHDKDFDPNGQPKKSHYHIIFVYDGPTTQKHVKDLCDSLNMVLPIKLESLRGMYRYHLHLDNPDKYQYDDRDRQFLGGFDPTQVEALTTTEVNKILKELVMFIEDNDIIEYRDLVFNLIHEPNMYDVAVRHTMFLNSYIRSKRHKMETREKLKEELRNEEYKNDSRKEED